MSEGQYGRIYFEDNTSFEGLSTEEEEETVRCLKFFADQEL